MEGESFKCLCENGQNKRISLRRIKFVEFFTHIISYIILLNEYYKDFCINIIYVLFLYCLFALKSSLNILNTYKKI